MLATRLGGTNQQSAARGAGASPATWRWPARHQARRGLAPFAGGSGRWRRSGGSSRTPLADAVPVRLTIGGELERERAVAARESGRDELAEIVGGGARVEECVANERHEIVEFGLAEDDRIREERVDGVEERCPRSYRSGEVGRQALVGGVVIEQRGAGVEMVSDGGCEARERAVMHEGRFDGDVAQ